jgi:hypothetical protein
MQLSGFARCDVLEVLDGEAALKKVGSCVVFLSKLERHFLSRV